MKLDQWSLQFLNAILLYLIMHFLISYVANIWEYKVTNIAIFTFVETAIV